MKCSNLFLPSEHKTRVSPWIVIKESDCKKECGVHPGDGVRSMHQQLSQPVRGTHTDQGTASTHHRERSGSYVSPPSFLSEQGGSAPSTQIWPISFQTDALKHCKMSTSLFLLSCWILISLRDKQPNQGDFSGSPQISLIMESQEQWPQWKPACHNAGRLVIWPSSTRNLSLGIPATHNTWYDASELYKTVFGFSTNDPKVSQDPVKSQSRINLAYLLGC